VLPLENITAFVLGTGADLPRDRLSRLDGYFTIGVNRIWRFGCTPAVSFWIDGGIYPERPWHFDRTLCVCDRSAKVRLEHIGLRMRPVPAAPRGKRRLPRYLNPNCLCHLPNTGVVAALWAVSLGCCPVVLLGMGCLDDGRSAGQLRAMRHALDDALAMDYRPSGACFPCLWQWGGDAGEFDENMHNHYVQPSDARRLTGRLREFFAHEPI